MAISMSGQLSASSAFDPVETILYEIADRKGVDPIDLPVLSDHIDPDALEAVLESASDVSVTFQYATHRVTVAGDGDVEITGP